MIAIAERSAIALVLLGLLWAPLPLGSNRDWAEAVLTLLFVGAGTISIFVWALPRARSNTADRLISIPKSIVVFAWVIWILWIICQYSGWPADKVAQISPHRAQINAFLVEAGLVQDSEPVSITVDREATLSRLALTTAYFGLFLAITVVFSLSRKRLELILWVIFLSGILQAIYGSLMVLTGLEVGFWGRKEHYLGSATGTFVNRNHFAGYLELTLAAAVGLYVIHNRTHTNGDLKRRVRQYIRQWDVRALIIRVCIVLIFIGLVLSKSRMGNTAALGGLGVAGLLYMVLRPRKQNLVALGLFLSVLVLDVWLIGGWFGLDDLVERYVETDITSDHRSDMRPDLEIMAKAYLTTGSGLGTFMVAYPEFRSEEVFGLNRHAHNDYAQFLIETGVIGISILSLMVFMTFYHSLRVIRNRRNLVYRGAALACLIALISIAIHSLVDFNLQIPANAATLIAIMAACWSCPPQSRHTTIEKSRFAKSSDS